MEYSSYLYVGERVGGRHIGVDELDVDQPRQQVLQQQLPYLCARRLEPRRDLCTTNTMLFIVHQSGKTIEQDQQRGLIKISENHP